MIFLVYYTVFGYVKPCNSKYLMVILSMLRAAKSGKKLGAKRTSYIVRKIKNLYAFQSLSCQTCFLLTLSDIATYRTLAK